MLRYCVGRYIRAISDLFREIIVIAHVSQLVNWLEEYMLTAAFIKAL